MPACVECGFPTQNLVVVESRNKALKRCQNCTRPCDRFLEYDAVQLVLCLVLLVKEAFAHVLFNIPNVSRKLMFVVIMSIALESYVVLVTTEYASFKRQHRDIISTTGSTSQNSGNILQTSMSSMNVGITSLSPDITVTATTTGAQQESTAMQQLLYNLTGTSDAEASAAMLFGVKLLGSTLSDLVSSAIKPNCSGSSIGDDLHNPQNFTIIDGDALRNVNETLRGIRKILSSDITVQLVPVFKQYTSQSLVKVVDFSRLPVLLGYAIAEFGFVSLCSIWMAGLLYPRDTYGGAAARSSSNQQLPNGAFSAFFSATCLASGAKLLYVMFLVWQIPPYLISIAEVAAVGWTHAGFRACGLSSRSALVLLAGSILARCLVRSLTLWAPQLLMLEAMVLR